MGSLAVIFVYALISSLGLVLIKKGLNAAGFSLFALMSSFVIFGFLLYGAGFIIWFKILNDNDLSSAFPVASGALFVFISIFSAYYLGENLSIVRVVGIAIIFIGIIFVSRG